MALINIEYGSLASSETMNKNFMYLDEKIADSSDSIMTSISSILSNIATINTRLNEITDSTNDSIENLTVTIEDYKNKTKLLVNKASMVPDWENCSTIEVNNNTFYTVEKNGYILLISTMTGNGNLIVNDKTIVCKYWNNDYDNASQIFTVPVFAGDSIKTNIAYMHVYYIPCKGVAIENF